MERKSKTSRFFHFPVTRIVLGVAAVATSALSVQFGSQAIIDQIVFNEDFGRLIVAILTSSAALATYYFLFRFYEKRKIEELSTSNFFHNSVTGLLTGFLFLSIVILIMYFGKAYTIVSVQPVSFLLPALALGISSGIFEEILFRGILFRITEEKLGSV